MQTTSPPQDTGIRRAADSLRDSARQQIEAHQAFTSGSDAGLIASPQWSPGHCPVDASGFDEMIINESYFRSQRTRQNKYALGDVCFNKLNRWHHQLVGKRKGKLLIDSWLSTEIELLPHRVPRTLSQRLRRCLNIPETLCRWLVIAGESNRSRFQSIRHPVCTTPGQGHVRIDCHTILTNKPASHVPVDSQGGGRVGVASANLTVGYFRCNLTWFDGFVQCISDFEGHVQWTQNDCLGLIKCNPLLRHVQLKPGFEGHVQYRPDYQGLVQCHPDTFGANLTVRDTFWQTWLSKTRSVQTWLSGTRSVQTWLPETRSVQTWLSGTRSVQTWLSWTRSVQTWLSGTRSVQTWLSKTRSVQTRLSKTRSVQTWLSGTRSVQNWLSTTRSVQTRLSKTRSVQNRLSKTRSVQNRLSKTRSVQTWLSGTRSVQTELSGTRSVQTWLSKTRSVQTWLSGLVLCNLDCQRHVRYNK